VSVEEFASVVGTTSDGAVNELNGGAEVSAANGKVSEGAAVGAWSVPAVDVGPRSGEGETSEDGNTSLGDGPDGGAVVSKGNSPVGADGDGKDGDGGATGGRVGSWGAKDGKTGGWHLLRRRQHLCL